MDKVYTVCEVAANHGGNFNRAKEMISVAAHYTKVSAVKFQKRTIDEFFPPEELVRPYENKNSFGRTYGEHRRALEFSIDQHSQLQQYAKSCGVDYGCSVWDLTAAKQIVSLDPDFVKIPSAANMNFEMIDWIMNNYTGPIHLSLGMTTRKEKEEIAEHITPNLSRFVTYYCVSAYPTPFESVCLANILDLDKFLPVKGLSGHHLGIAVDIAAFAVGCTYFERHFTLDRTSKGTDHAASLEPEGMRKLVRDLDNVQKAMGRNGAELMEIEKEARKKLRRVK